MAIHGKESHMEQTTSNAPDERISPEQIRQTWLDGGRRRGHTAGQLGGAGRNILRNPRSYINFIIAIFIIQTLLCLLMTVAELDNRTAYREITEHYDYHMQLRSISQPQYAELHNLDAEIPLDWRPYLPYKSITYERLADGRYHAYITLRGNDLALERQQVCDGFLESVGAAGESLVISYTPLYNYLTYYAVNIRVETGWAVFLFSALSLFMLTTLYNARLNHERFQYGIYMACGAGFRQLFTTAVGEMLFIVLLTALPAVIVANVTAVVLYAGTGTEYSLRLLPLLLTWLLGVLIAFFAVWMPMRHLSRRPPVALLAAQDNSNLVTSPRRSLHIFGRRFPSHYEAFSLWRYRRYLAGLLCASVLFAALWLGLIRVADFRTVLATASAPEFTVEFHPTAPNATTLNENVEWLSSDLEAIDGVDHCEYKVSTSLMAKRTFLAVTAKAARHAGAYTVHFEDQSGVYGAATNYAEYVALNEDSLRRLTERTASMEGDPARLLSEENTVILSTSLHNAERFDFAPGDTVLLAVNTQSTITTVPYLTMNNLDLLRIILSDEEFILEEYTVAAVVHDEAAGDRIMIGVDHGTYEDLTGMEAYTTALDVYLADEMDFGTLRTLTDRVQLAANDYFSTTVVSHGVFFDNYLTAFRNVPGRIVVAAYLILTMMPLLCFFSQQIFYGKRQKEWYVLRALGASRASRLRLLLMSGCILTAVNLVVMLLPGLLADRLAFKLCNEWLPAGGFIPSVLMEYRLSPAVIPVLLLFAVISGFIPCLIEYVRAKRAFVQEDALERALQEERDCAKKGEV